MLLLLRESCAPGDGQEDDVRSQAGLPYAEDAGARLRVRC